MRQIKILEIFAGIGSATQAFKNIGFEVESTPIEIDRKILDIYTQFHNYGGWNKIEDITKINKENWPHLFIQKFDIAVMGFPCQDISRAGKQQGLVEGTRSSLLWESLILIKEMEHKPRYLLFENVKAFNNKKFENDREKLNIELEKIGYEHNNCSIILNAKNFGIPQNRERWFSLFSIDDNFDCPFCSQGFNGFELIYDKKIPMKPLKDFLEDISFEQWKKVNQYKEFSNFIVIPRAKDNQLINGSYNRLWKTDKHVGTLNITNPIKIFNKNSFFWRKYKTDKEVSTIRTKGNIDIFEKFKDQGYFRKLTPRECGRLMGWNDKEIDKVIHLPKSHLYKAFGNAIVIPVLEEIFKILFKEYFDENPIFKEFEEWNNNE